MCVCVCVFHGGLEDHAIVILSSFKSSYSSRTITGCVCVCVCVCVCACGCRRQEYEMDESVSLSYLNVQFPERGNATEAWPSLCLSLSLSYIHTHTHTHMTMIWYKGS